MQCMDFFYFEEDYDRLAAELITFKTTKIKVLRLEYITDVSKLK